MEAFNTFITTYSLILSKAVEGDDIILNNTFNNSEEEIRFLGIDAPKIKQCKKLIQDGRETQLAGQLLMMLGRLSLNF